MSEADVAVASEYMIIPFISCLEAIMKRDMDLIRKLLLKIEEMDKPPLSAILSEEADNAEYHIIVEHLSMLIEEAALVSGNAYHMMDGTNWNDLRLTWQGHDFVDAIRDPEIWGKTKKGALAAGGFTFDLLKDLAKGFVKKQISERTGVEL